MGNLLWTLALCPCDLCFTLLVVQDESPCLMMMSDLESCSGDKEMVMQSWGRLSRLC